MAVLCGLAAGIALTRQPLAATGVAICILIFSLAFQHFAGVERAGFTLLLAATLILGYGFANVGLRGGTPIPAAEMLVVPLASVALLERDTRLPRRILLPLLFFALLTAVRLAFDYPVWGADAVRDSTIPLEALTLAIGYRAVRRDGIEPWLRRLRIIFLLLLTYSISYPWRGELQSISPTVGLDRPSVPLFGTFGGVNFGAAAGAVFLAEFLRGWRRFVPILVLSGLIAIFQARTLYVLFPISLLLLGFLVRRPVRMVLQSAGVIVLGLAIVFGFSASLGIEGRKGPVDLSFVTANAGTIVGEQGPAQGTITDRAEWARQSLSMFRQNVGTMAVGVGLGPDLIGGFGSHGPVRKPHNDYLEILTRMGILGLCLYVWLLVACIVPIWQMARKRGGLPSRFCAWVIAAVVIYLGVSAVQPVMAFPYGTVPVFSFLGMGLAAAISSQAPKKQLSRG